MSSPTRPARLALAVLLPVLLLAGLPYTSASAQAKASWTIMVYMAADNDLEPYALLDLEEMEQVGSTDQVKIVVLVDRSERPYEHRYGGLEAYEDWSDARIYLIQHHPGEGLGSKLLARLGEVNMGDPETLAKFISMAVERFPADHYALIIWDHGSSLGMIGIDVESRDHITLRELRAALQKTGVKLDLLGFDACLMATIETIYSVADTAKVMVASEETEPGDGWHYTPFLRALAENPSMTAEELAKRIVDSYIEFYRPMGVRATLSAVNLEALRGRVVELMKPIASYVAENPQAAANARPYTVFYGGGGRPEEGASSVDLIGLLEAMKAGGAPVDQALEALRASVIVSKGLPETGRDKGIAIYYPMRLDLGHYKAMTDFGEVTGWTRALTAAANVEPEISEQPIAEAQLETTGAGQLQQLGGEEGGSIFLGLPAAGGVLDVDNDGADEVVLVMMSLDNETGGLATRYIVLDYDRDTGELKTTIDRAITSTRDENSLLVPFEAKEIDSNGDGKPDLVAVAQQVITLVEEYGYGYGGGYGGYGDMAGMGLPFTLTGVVVVVDPATGKVVQGVTIDDLLVAGVDAGDVDGDKRVELVVMGTKMLADMSEPPSIELYIADPRTLELETSFTISPPEGYMMTIVNSFTVADADGDGVKDVVFSRTFSRMDPYTGEQEERAQLLALSFSGGRPHSAGTLAVPPAELSRGDIDNDGVEEIIASTGSDRRIIWITPGKEGMEVESGFEYRGEYNQAYATAYDIDGDGVKELLVVLSVVPEEEFFPTKGDLLILSVTENGVKKEKTIENIYTEKGMGTGIPIAADLDGDGEKQELVYIAVSLEEELVKVTAKIVENYVIPTGALEGTVKDEQGNPVAGANVTVSVPRLGEEAKEYHTVTDEQGRFRVERLPAATYQVTVEHGGKRAYTTVKVEPGNTTHVELVLTEKQGRTILLIAGAVLNTQIPGSQDHTAGGGGEKPKPKPQTPTSGTGGIQPRGTGLDPATLGSGVALAAAIAFLVYALRKRSAQPPPPPLPPPPPG